MVVEDRLVVLSGALLDRAAGHLAAGEPAGGIGPERGPLGAFGRCVLVPEVGVDLTTPVGQERFGVHLRAERLRSGDVAAVRTGVADLVAAGWQSADAAERAFVAPVGVSCQIADRRFVPWNWVDSQLLIRAKYVPNELTSCSA